MTNYEPCTGFIAIALLTSPTKTSKIYFRQNINGHYTAISNQDMLRKSLGDVLSITGLEYKLK